MARRWTKAEDLALLAGVGTYGIAWFRRKAGPSYHGFPSPNRSRKAVRERLVRLRGGGAGCLTQGARTLNWTMEGTGYSRTQLLRAARALNQQWKRLGPDLAYLISDEQYEDLVAWLQHDYWCVRLRLYACVDCGGMRRPPKALGLCGRCYYRMRRLCVRLGVSCSLGAFRTLAEEMNILGIGPRLARGIAPSRDQLHALAGVSCSMLT